MPPSPTGSDRTEGPLARDLGPWRSARTFDDLLRLARRFLQGELDAFPGWGGRDLDEESDDLAAVLLALNAAGVLTVASQPGRPFSPGHDGRDWAGRAFVGGFAAAGTAAALAARARGAGLLTVEAPAGATPPAVEVIAGLRDGAPYLVLGGDAGEHERGIFAEEAGARAAEALGDRTFLWLVEPAWGRRERFVAALGDATPPAVESAAPDPGEGRGERRGADAPHRSTPGDRP